MHMIHMAVRMARYKIQNLSSAYFFTYLYRTWVFQSAKENPQNIRFPCSWLLIILKSLVKLPTTILKAYMYSK